MEGFGRRTYLQLIGSSPVLNPNNPVLTPGAKDSWDDTQVFAPSICNFKVGGFRLTYVGYDGSTERIGWAKFVS